MARSAPDTAAARPAPSQDANDVVAVEQRWLLSFFEGTPVEIARGTDGALTVTVPAAFCFHPGSAIIKAPLAKVLEKVAVSLRRRPALRVPLVEAPADANSASALALQRARAVQRRLRSFGIAQQRFGSAQASEAGTVRLRLQVGPQAGASPA